MPFQTTVNKKLGLGVIGDIVRDGPSRGQACTLNDQGGMIGYAATFVGDGTNTIQMGGTGKFAGIVANTKTAPLYGTTAGGTLAASLALQPSQQCEVVNMTSGIVLQNTNGTAYANGIGLIGSEIWFVQATGAIYVPTAAEATAGPTAGYTEIVGARIVSYSTTAQPTTGDIQNLIVAELTLTTTTTAAAEA